MSGDVQHRRRAARDAYSRRACAFTSMSCGAEKSGQGPSATTWPGTSTAPSEGFRGMAFTARSGSRRAKRGARRRKTSRSTISTGASSRPRTRSPSDASRARRRVASWSVSSTSGDTVARSGSSCSTPTPISASKKSSSPRRRSAAGRGSCTDVAVSSSLRTCSGRVERSAPGLRGCRSPRSVHRAR